MKNKLLANPLKTTTEWGIGKAEKLTKVDSPFLLVRHAESKFNLEIENVEKIKHQLSVQEYKKLKNKVRFSEEFLDCDITDKGLEQCFEAGQNLKDVNIKYVFVSPLKRCLKTCENILNSANHKPQVKVFPSIFEKIEDSCDLLNDIHKNMNDWAHYDWTLFKDIEHLPIYQLRYCDNVHPDHREELHFDTQEDHSHTVHISPQFQFKRNDKRSHIYYHKAIHNFTQYKNYHQHKLVVDAMERLEQHDIYIESSIKTIERLFHLKNFISNFTATNKVNSDEKILIIGHSIIFKHLTAKQLNDHSYEPAEGEMKLKNCEIAGIKFTDFKH